MLKTFAMIFGIVFLAIGIAGFFVLNPSGPGSTGADLTMNHGEGVLMGLFPVNTLHNAAHILFGLWGLAASRSVGGARGYFRGVAIGYGLLTILGLIPQTQTLFGLVPLHGNDVWLHGVLALAGVYFGWIHRERTVADAR